MHMNSHLLVEKGLSSHPNLLGIKNWLSELLSSIMHLKGLLQIAYPKVIATRQILYGISFFFL